MLVRAALDRDAVRGELRDAVRVELLCTRIDPVPLFGMRGQTTTKFPSEVSAIFGEGS
jgi:hypothetical protein